MEKEIKIPESLAKEIGKISVELGFNGDSEFVEEAIKQKILETKKIRFFEISDKISSGLKKNGVKPEEILGTR